MTALQLELPDEIVRQFVMPKAHQRPVMYSIRVREQGEGKRNSRKYRPGPALPAPVMEAVAGPRFRAGKPVAYTVFGLPVESFVRLSARPWKRPDDTPLYQPQPGDGCTLETLPE